MFDKFSAKLKKLNDARKHTREPFICGFHGTVMRLFDVGPDKLSPEERALLLEENSSWVEGACQALPRTCPRHSEWVALYKDEILAELDNGAATLRRLKREETDIVETLETRMEIAVRVLSRGEECGVC